MWFTDFWAVKGNGTDCEHKISIIGKNALSVLDSFANRVIHFELSQGWKINF